MSSPFFSRPGPGGFSPILPQFRFRDADGSCAFVNRSRDPSTGLFTSEFTPVPFGTLMVVDTGYVFRGPLRYRPYDESHLEPLIDLNRPPPPKPDDDYTDTIRIQVLVQGFGLAMWTASGIIVQNQLFNLYMQAQYAAEAAAGQVPIVKLCPSRQIQIASRNNEVHTAPVLEIVGWTNRDPGRFGPRRCPPPLAVIGGSPIRPPLAGSQAAPIPANDESLPWTETPATPAPVTPVTPAASSASAAPSTPPVAAPKAPATPPVAAVPAQPANTNQAPPANDADDVFSGVVPSKARPEF